MSIWMDLVMAAFLAAALYANYRHWSSPQRALSDDDEIDLQFW